MGITVITFASYLTTSESGSWRTADHGASKFIKALKGDSYKGYAQVPVNGATVRIDSGDRDTALRCFGRMAAGVIPKKPSDQRIVLIPIPDKGCLINNTCTPKTLELAQAAQQCCTQRTIEILDVLRWSKAMTKARAGGSRTPHVLYSALCCKSITETLRNTIFILLDDVKTSGAHIQAASARLCTDCNIVVKHAMCAGRTVHEPPADPFATFKETLDAYSPA